MGPITRSEIIEDKALKWGGEYAESVKQVIEVHAEVVESIKALNEQLKSVQKGGQFDPKPLNKARIATQELNKQEKQLARTEARLKTAVRSTNKQIQLKSDQLRKTNRAVKLNELANAALEGSYAKIEARLNRNIQRWKALSREQRENSKEGKRLAQTIQRQDRELKKLDATIGRSQRHVGNYGRAFSKLRTSMVSLASALGIANGFFALARVMSNAVQILRQFEKQNATLAAVLQKSKQEIVALREDAKRLGATTIKTASEVSRLQIAYARLGFSQRDILDLTEPTISGSIALNAELERTALLVGAVVKSFSEFEAVDAPAIIDILSLATATSALNFSKLETAIPIVATAADAAGVSMTRTTAILGKLSDAGFDATRSSTALRNIFLEAAAQGLSYEEILVKIQNSTDKLKRAYDEFGKRGATAGVITSRDIEDIKEYDLVLQRAAGTAKRMADKELATLDGAIQLLRSAWQGVIFDTGEVGSLNERLRSSLRFLAINLQSIIKVIGILIASWLSYKATVGLLIIQKRLLTKQTFAYRLAVVATSGGVRGLTRALRLLWATMRANPLILAVAGFAALYTILLKIRKAFSDNTREIINNNNVYISKKKETDRLSDATQRLLDRYQKLKKEASDNEKEQQELKNVIQAISNAVPGAATGFNEYSEAIDINEEKVQKHISSLEGLSDGYKDLVLESAKRALEVATKEREALDELFNTNQPVYIKELEGTFRKTADGIEKALNSSYQSATSGLIKTKDDFVKTSDETATQIKEIYQTLNQEIQTLTGQIADASGKTNLNSLRDEFEGLVKELNKYKDDPVEFKIVETGDIDKDTELYKKEIDKIGDLIQEAQKKLDETPYLTKLRNQIKAIQKDLRKLEKTPLNLRTETQIKNIDDAKAKIKELQDEINRLTGTSSGLAELRLKNSIKVNTDIAKNEELFLKERLDAFEKAQADELTLAKITKQNKIANGKDVLVAEEEYNGKVYEIEKKYAKLREGISDGLSKRRVKAAEEANEAIENKHRQLFNNEKALLQQQLLDGEIDRKEYNRRLEELESQHHQNVLKEKIQFIRDFLELDALLKEGSIYSTAERAAKLKELDELEKQLLNEQTQAHLKSTTDREKALESLQESAEVMAKVIGGQAEPFKELFDIIINGFEETDTKFERMARTAKAVSQVFGEIGTAVYDNVINKIDEEMEATEERYSRQIELAEGNDQQIRLLEIQRDKDLKKLEDEKEKAENKRNKIKKATAAFEIAINTASGVVEALPNIPLSIIVGVLGAAQLAAVLATPVPKYREGTESHPGGLAIVGDGSKKEVVMTPSGEVYTTPAVPTLANIEEGARVFKSIPSYNDFLKASILTSVHADNQRLSNFQAANNFKELNGLDKKIEQGIEKGFKKAKVNNYVKLPKIDIDHAVWAAKGKNW